MGEYTYDILLYPRDPTEDTRDKRGGEGEGEVAIRVLRGLSTGPKVQHPPTLKGGGADLERTQKKGPVCPTVREHSGETPTKGPESQEN